MCLICGTGHKGKDFQYIEKQMGNQIPHSRLFSSKEPSLKILHYFYQHFIIPCAMLQEIILDQDYLFLLIDLVLKSVTNQYSKLQKASYFMGE